jgi:hypothetical protein
MLVLAVDVESDGPIPGDFSMISLGAVVVEEGLSRTFYGRFRPISERFVPEALAVSGHSREETLGFPEAAVEMQRFAEWLEVVSRSAPAGEGKHPASSRLLFASDNNGFDWQFVNWYFHHFLGKNPFGHSSMNIGSLYKGLVKSTFENFKHLRKTAHTHHPVDDAKGNAEALLAMRSEYGLKLPLK